MVNQPIAAVIKGVRMRSMAEFIQGALAVEWGALSRVVGAHRRFKVVNKRRLRVPTYLGLGGGAVERRVGGLIPGIDQSRVVRGV